MILQKGDSSITASRAALLEQESVPAGSFNDDQADDFELVIRRQSGWIGINWKEMFSHHELVFNLIWRDILVRYKQTVLGLAWVILQPLILMVIFRLSSGDSSRSTPKASPYSVFVLAALIPWTLFSQGKAQSSLSMINQQYILTNVYFLRLYVPFAAASPADSHSYLAT